MPSHTRKERAKRRTRRTKRRSTPKIGTRVLKTPPTKRRISRRRSS